jgi:hypothetical protein
MKTVLPVGQLIFCNIEWENENQRVKFLKGQSQEIAKCVMGDGLTWLTASDFIWLIILKDNKCGVELLIKRNIGGMKMRLIKKGTSQHRDFQKIRKAYLGNHKKFNFKKDEE